jgi:hypothetical protein
VGVDVPAGGDRHLGDRFAGRGLEARAHRLVGRTRRERGDDEQHGRQQPASRQ